MPALKEGPEKDCVGVNYAYWTKRGTWGLSLLAFIGNKVSVGGMDVYLNVKKI